MTCSGTKFEVVASNGWGGNAFTKKKKKKHYLTFDLDLGARVTQTVAQYPLHHVTYSGTKFEVATSISLGGDTFTRNVKDGIHLQETSRTDDGVTLVRN